MTVILALDIAKDRTGWALGRADEQPVSGVFETQNWTKVTADRELDRWRRWLSRMCEQRRFEAVAHECIFVDVRDRKKFQFSGTQAQMMMAGILFQWCYERKIPTFEAMIPRWRGHFLGFTSRPAGTDPDYWKTSAMEECRRRGWDWMRYHDEAEALGILDYAQAQFGKLWGHGHA